MQNFIFIRVDKKNIKVNYDEIIYIESVKNYIRIITNKKIFVLLNKLNQIETVLCPEQFCRIHCSYIISFKHIAAFDNNSVYLENKITLPISRAYKVSLEEHTTILTACVVRDAKIMKERFDNSYKNEVV